MPFDLTTLESLEPQVLGVTDWQLISQKAVNTFAEVTNDHQWIHVDVEQCKNESPYGTTIAHGFLTLSLLSSMIAELELFPQGTTVINYGLDKVRFLAPVLVGVRVRNRLEFVSAESKKQGLLVKTKNTVEIEHKDTPALVAESLMLILS